MRMLAAAAVALTMAATPSFAAGDATAGQAVFAKCAVCHNIGAGAKNKIGPALTGVVGRQPGTFAGFNYSPAMELRHEECSLDARIDRAVRAFTAYRGARYQDDLRGTARPDRHRQRRRLPAIAGRTCPVGATRSPGRCGAIASSFFLICQIDQAAVAVLNSGMDITLKQLEIFQAVVIAGSITEASRRIGLSQPSHSQHWRN